MVQPPLETGKSYSCGNHLISGLARLTGVIGDPVGHSLSPAMHGYWLACNKIDAAYVPLAIKPQHLEGVFRNLPKLGFVGVNITLPYKEQIMPMLDEIEPEAEEIGAVNTVIFEDDGKIIGTNTDGFGFRIAMSEAMPMWGKHVKTALVLGAGGATHAIVHELKRASVSTILIANRTYDKAAAIADRFGPKVKAITWEEQNDLHGEIDLLVNTTSLGMLHEMPLEIEVRNLKPGAMVMDAVYNPLETDLLRKARQNGHLTVSGLGMLIHQGRAAFQRWFGVDPKVDEALKVILASRLS
jgi:shikimate dehydrogenase